MDTNVTPQITVLMAVYNGEKYLEQAIKSILWQTFTDFEFVIIDDGSTDKSPDIIKSFEDNRIKYIANEKNMGLPYSLNRGLELARGEFIVRMDADDISLPNRLQKQVTFMEENPQIAVCGSFVKTFGGKRDEFVHTYFTDPNDIEASLLFNTSLAHPSVMMRKSELKKYNLKYETDFKYFEEDYNLWVELSQKSQLANLPEVLLFYRLHEKSVTHLNTENRQAGISMIRQKQLEKLGLNPNPENIRIHNALRPNDRENLKEFLDKEEIWLSKIIAANEATHIYKPESLAKIISARWYLLCSGNAKNFSVWRKFSRSKLYSKKSFESLKIFIKCLL